MKLGFVGTGTITTAVVTGLCTSVGPPERILVSPRNAAKAAKLAEAFPRVAVAADNQEVIDGSDSVCLALVPQIARQVLESLTFRSEQRIISFIATLPAAELSALISPASAPVRAVPLPCVARHLGPVAICPPDREVSKLLGRIGSTVEVDEERELYALWSVTSLMAPYFALMNETTNWLTDNGVDAAAGARYTAAMFHGLAVSGLEAKSADFYELVKEHQTPRGLNEQALNTLVAANWCDAVREVLDSILGRLEGRTS